MDALLRYPRVSPSHARRGDALDVVPRPARKRVAGAGWPRGPFRGSGALPGERLAAERGNTANPFRSQQGRSRAARRFGVSEIAQLEQPHAQEGARS